MSFIYKVSTLLTLTTALAGTSAFAIDDPAIFKTSGDKKTVTIEGRAEGATHELYSIVSKAGKKVTRGLKPFMLNQFKFKTNGNALALVATEVDSDGDRTSDGFTVEIEYEASAQVLGDHPDTKGPYLRIIGGAPIVIREAVLAAKAAKNEKGFVNTKFIKNCGVSTNPMSRKMPSCEITGVYQRVIRTVIHH